MGLLSPRASRKRYCIRDIAGEKPLWDSIRDGPRLVARRGEWQATWVRGPQEQGIWVKSQAAGPLMVRPDAEGSGSCGGSLAIYTLGMERRLKRGCYRSCWLNEDTFDVHASGYGEVVSTQPGFRGLFPAYAGVVGGGQDACHGKSSLPGPIAALIGERDRVAIHRRSELGAFGEGSFSAPTRRGREIGTGPKAQHIKRPARLDEASTRWSTVLEYSKSYRGKGKGKSLKN
ncbi:hypothetical protein GLAREA_00768 [Glarea lozoyensis ATCC 20868]|uniref:Uncharacterized protein n=1 Tax=Glarea lozoyensis (strain ATCC 20868 / MF5171) TaxID=1116229 RepID=S3DT47_GLAL2|nr:uncharacterized protein GLAREA_00768 [Glarea lozoyensis ATCC 20868]EPE29608.1 hypothetical protein GLAREA_00768 [Glarea lozoyensis ATCC 20868]